MPEETQALVRKSDVNEMAVEDAFSQLEKAVGGRMRIVEGLMTSRNPEAKRYLKALGDSRNGNVSLYQVCKDLQRSPEELLTIFTEGSLVKATMQAHMKLAEGMPTLIDKSITVATNFDDAFKEREMLFKMAGMLKEGGGVTLNLSQNVNSNNLKVGEGAFEDIVKKSSQVSRSNPFDVEIVDAEIISEKEENNDKADTN